MSEKTYTHEEVKSILLHIHEFYDIFDNPLFKLAYLSGVSDKPSDEYIQKCIEKDIESFIY